MRRDTQSMLRVGAVPFLNARPLVHGLDAANSPPIELRLEVPSVLSEMTRQNLLDVALMPSIEYFRADNYRILADISISADGPVESVMIFSEVPIERIRSLALDETSRTSATLAKILLKRKLESVPTFTQCSPRAALRAINADAMMLIGDAAMAFHTTSPPYILDMGEEWKKQTGLPFVYAMWVARHDVEMNDLHSRLLKARDDGISNLEKIAADASRELGLDGGTCLNYLKNIMRYELGSREIEALRLFQKLAAEDGLCRGDVEIVIGH